MSWNKGQQANLNPQQKAYGRQAGLIRKKASISQPLPPRTWQPASHWLSFWRLVYLFSYCFVFCFEHISGGFDLFVTDRTCLSWAWSWSLTLAAGCMSCGHHRAIWSCRRHPRAQCHLSGPFWHPDRRHWHPCHYHGCETHHSQSVTAATISLHNLKKAGIKKTLPSSVCIS